jgi:hypothetical protein
MGIIYSMVVSTDGSGIGWWGLGEFWGMAGALAMSTAGGINDFHYGWKWNREPICK